jgi:hypothetical protein
VKALALLLAFAPAAASASGAAAAAQAAAAPAALAPPKASLSAGDYCLSHGPADDVPLVIERPGDVPMPVPICNGQKAPANGIFMVRDRGVIIEKGWNEAMEERTRLRAALQAKPSGWTTQSLLTAGALGAVVGAVLTAVVVSKVR